MPERTRYNPEWNHIEYRRPPDEDDALLFPRFYGREITFPDNWTCHYRDIRYNPRDRVAAVFIYRADAA